jgi:hypothetical protein
MAEQIDWAFSLKVAAGPSLSGTGKSAVEIYDKTSETIPAGESADIEILPAASDELALVAITADQYGADPGPITYQQDDADTTPITLDGPVTLIGAGAAAMFPKELSTLTFTNGTAAPVVIQILIGRNA